MNKLKIITVALTFSLVLISTFQVKVSGTYGNVAYIYSTDLASAESYRSFLGAHGLSVDLVSNSTAATWDYSDYELIIIGSDTGSRSNWEPVAAVPVIDGSDKPILGLGEGGYAFFGKLYLDIGYPSGWHGYKTFIYVVDVDHQIFHFPTELTIPPDSIIQLYDSTGHVGISMPSAVPGVTPLGRESDDLDHYPLIQEDTRYVLWGFTNSPAYMTQIGKDLFVNIVTWLRAPEAPTASFTFSPSSPKVDETVSFNASLSSDSDGTIVNYAWDFGDGSHETGKTTTHAYTTAGTYTVTLTVTDDDDLADIATTNIHVDPSPVDPTPPIGSVEINGDAAATDSVSVTLTLYAEDAESGVAEMRFSNDGSSWSDWEGYATSKAWTLTAGDGTKKVHVQFKNNAGLVSDTYSDTIALSIEKERSSISISMSATTLTVGESTTVSGFLSPICEGASVTIQCRRSGGTWTTLEKVTTGSDGGYWCTWKPTAVGTYEVRASWEGDETTLSSESIGQLITVKASSAAAFPWWILAPVIGGITGVTAVLVYLVRRKPKEEVLKLPEPIITAEPTEIPAPAKKTKEAVLKPAEEILPQKVKELPKLSAKCCDTIALLNIFIEDPSLTNDRKAWKGFREFITIAEQIEDEYAELIEIRNKLAVLRRKRNEYIRAGLDDLADKTQGLIQSNYGESIRIIKEIQEKLPHLGG